MEIITMEITSMEKTKVNGETKEIGMKLPVGVKSIKIKKRTFFLGLSTLFLAGCDGYIFLVPFQLAAIAFVEIFGGLFP